MRNHNSPLLNMTSQCYSYREHYSLHFVFFLALSTWSWKGEVKNLQELHKQKLLLTPFMHIRAPTFILYPFSSINIVAVFLKLLFQDFRNFYAYCSFFHVPFCMSVLFFFLQQISKRKQYIGCETLTSIVRIQVDNSLKLSNNTALEKSANSFLIFFN